jgi:signal transduction histidine kinase
LRHDLGQPLIAARLSISSALEQLSDVHQLADVPNPLELRCRLDSAAQCLEDMRALLQRSDRRRLRTSSASSVAVDVVAALSPIAREKSVQLILTLADGSAPIAMARAPLFRVISNLIGNAIRHSRPSGTVSVSTTARAQDVLFRVKDSGDGISPAHLPRIFDLEWLAHSEIRVGSGRGLSIAKRIVEQYGGKIFAMSRPGYGATFSFAVPRAER